MLAIIAGTAVTYHHPDYLSDRAETDATGIPTRTFGHFPYGEAWYETGTPDKWKFTKYERDSGVGETGLDYARFRYYSSGQARFLSPDLLAGHLSTPQSLNRYAYVTNDPVNLVDPLGLHTEGVTVTFTDSAGNASGSQTTCREVDDGDDGGGGNIGDPGDGGGSHGPPTPGRGGPGGDGGPSTSVKPKVDLTKLAVRSKKKCDLYQRRQREAYIYNHYDSWR
jgi:RHS repeat-associated protein